MHRLMSATAAGKDRPRRCTSQRELRRASLDDRRIAQPCVADHDLQSTDRRGPCDEVFADRPLGSRSERDRKPTPSVPLGDRQRLRSAPTPANRNQRRGRDRQPELGSSRRATTAALARVKAGAIELAGIGRGSGVGSSRRMVKGAYGAGGAGGSGSLQLGASGSRHA